MTLEMRVERHAEGGRATPVGPFDLAHASRVEEVLLAAEGQFEGCGSVTLDLAEVGRLDGSGAALLTRFLDRLDTAGCQTRILAAGNPEAERLVLVYRRGPATQPAVAGARLGTLARLGDTAAELPRTAHSALDFI